MAMAKTMIKTPARVAMATTWSVKTVPVEELRLVFQKLCLAGTSEGAPSSSSTSPTLTNDVLALTSFSGTKVVDWLGDVIGASVGTCVCRGGSAADAESTLSSPPFG